MNNQDILVYLSMKMRGAGEICLNALGDSLCFYRGAITKIFVPKIRRRVGALMLDGYVGFTVSIDALVKENISSNDMTKPTISSACPIMNFPLIVMASKVTDGCVSDEFISQLSDLIDKIPNSLPEMSDKLGAEFFQKNSLERTIVLAKYLR